MPYGEEEGRSEQRTATDGRGGAVRPPGRRSRPRWWELLKRVASGISEKNLPLIAAGQAFYAFLAIPAASAALLSLYGLAFNPADVMPQVVAMHGVMPREAVALIANVLTGLTTRSRPSLGIGLVVSILIALWSANSAMTGLMSALNIAYREKERRGLLTYYTTALALTTTVVVFTVVALVLVAVLPAAIALLPFAGFDAFAVSILRWPILIVLLFLVLAVLFRFAPSHAQPQWRWVSWGALAAALLWIAGSALFSLYVGWLATYDKTYGSLGAVVVLLMWLYLSAYAVLFGANLDAEIDRNRAHDREIEIEGGTSRRDAGAQPDA